MNVDGQRRGFTEGPAAQRLPGCAADGIDCADTPASSRGAAASAGARRRRGCGAGCGGGPGRHELLLAGRRGEPRLEILRPPEKELHVRNVCGLRMTLNASVPDGQPVPVTVSRAKRSAGAGLVPACDRRTLGRIQRAPTRGAPTHLRYPFRPGWVVGRQRQRISPRAAKAGLRRGRRGRSFRLALAESRGAPF